MFNTLASLAHGILGYRCLHTLCLVYRNQPQIRTPSEAAGFVYTFSGELFSDRCLCRGAEKHRSLFCSAFSEISEEFFAYLFLVWLSKLKQTIWWSPQCICFTLLRRQCVQITWLIGAHSKTLCCHMLCLVSQKLLEHRTDSLFHLPKIRRQTATIYLVLIKTEV